MYNYTFTNATQGTIMNVPYPYAVGSVAEVTVRAVAGGYRSYNVQYVWNMPPCSPGAAGCGSITQVDMQNVTVVGSGTFGFDGITRVNVTAIATRAMVDPTGQHIGLVLSTFSATGDVGVEVRVRLIAP